MEDPELELLRVAHHLTPEEVAKISDDPVVRNKQRRFIGAVQALYFQTERVRKKRARSWRNFLVACGVWAYDENIPFPEPRERWFYGMNIKYGEHERNTCAEQIAVGAAMATTSTEIVGIVIIGKRRKEEDGSKPPTLPPCPHCRKLLAHSHLVTPNTLIITIHPPTLKTLDWYERPRQIRTLAEIRRDCGDTL